jgi:hypothetical protein
LGFEKMLKKYIAYFLLCLASVSLGLRLYVGHNPLPYFLQILPFPSTILGPPKSYIYAKQCSELLHMPYYSIIPEHFVTNAPFPFAQEEQKTFFPEVFVLKIPKGRIYGRNGVVITPKDQILADTAIEWIPSIEKHSLFRKCKLHSLKKVEGKVAVMASKSADCYFHWMFDILPRLEILRLSQVQYDKIYLNPLNHAFQKETFEKLHLDPEKIIWADRYQHIQADEVIVPSLPAERPGPIPGWVINFLNDKFLSSQNQEPHKRLYISREKANSRKIMNEEELFQALEPLGFE